MAEVAAKEAASLWRDRVAGLLAGLDALRAMRPRVAQAARTQWSWDRSGEILAAVLRDAIDAA